MNKRRRRMPRLNLLAEKELDPRGILFGNVRKDIGIEGVEHLCAERTHVIEVKLYRVDRLRGNIGRIGLAGEFWGECHGS